ncbi:Chorismatase [Pontiella desulfatans]|uniref:Chorismatase n=2 Tax=Pontiella desulfatans TaxID=2750659 RepID=A0A6C2U7R1_PONDE|nr:Chorismatase [Pontiella desulfatans]
MLTATRTSKVPFQKTGQMKDTLNMEESIINPTDTMQIVEFPHDGVKAYFTTANTTEENMHDVFDRVSAEMAERGAKIAFQYLFGGRQFYPQAVSAIKQLDWPLTLLHGDACSGSTITGTQFIALSGTDLHPVMDGDRKVGNWYDTEDARYCLLGDIRADDLTLGREEQARAVFEKMENLLKQADMVFTDIARTWIYLNNLLEWYDEFNVVRTQFFKERGTFEKMVPASTGIGAGSAAGEEMVCALWAVKPKHDGVKVFAVPSPLQCPALDYKSSFARAVEIDQPGSRLLTISGTASIEPGGKTVHLDDCEKQIGLTMEVVHEILKSRGMDWGDTSRAIAYFKNFDEAHLLAEYCTKNNLPELPVAISHADVCRHDLLFEIELDAVKAN